MTVEVSLVYCRKRPSPTDKIVRCPLGLQRQVYVSEGAKETVKHIKLGTLDVARIGLGAMGMSSAYTGAGRTSNVTCVPSTRSGQSPPRSVPPRPRSPWPGCWPRAGLAVPAAGFGESER
jgi:hypothetical protein